MRIGFQLPEEQTAAWAAEADAAGVFALLVPAAGGLSAVLAPAVALATRDARIVVPVALGSEHPVTLAEELAVLDALTGGRLVALVDTGDLDAEAATEDVLLLRRALSGRPLRHRGARWTVPAGIAPDVSDSVIVTPGTTQLELPVWLAGRAAPALAEATGLPVATTDPALPLRQDGPQPALAVLAGDLAADRDLVTAWATAGATLLLLAAPEGAAPGFLRDYVARYLIPEVAMVDFPRLMAETAPPPVWPGALSAIDE